MDDPTTTPETGGENPAPDSGDGAGAMTTSCAVTATAVEETTIARASSVAFRIRQSCAIWLNSNAAEDGRGRGRELVRVLKQRPMD